MRLIIIGLLVSVFFVGCGYKADPVYVDDNVEKKVNNNL